jgi:AhpD family alkylhydroperoxidase
MTHFNRLNLAVLSADGYNGLISVENYIHGALDLKLLSLVKLRASQINGCAFCLHMHYEEALKAGDTPARLNLLPAWEESRMFTEKERAALLWTESLTNIATDRAEDETYAEVKAHFTDKEMADLTLAVAMINAWNRIAISMRFLHANDKPAA